MIEINERAGLLTRQRFRLSHQQWACLLILITIALERAAFHSFADNLLFFLMKAPLCWRPSYASTAQLVMAGVMYSIGLLTGWISDSYLGRYGMIILGFVMYVCGYSYLTLIASYLNNISSYTEHFTEGSWCVGNISESNLPFCLDSAQFKFSECEISVYIAVVLLALGSGIVRTNLIPFGADQVAYLSLLVPTQGERKGGRGREGGGSAEMRKQLIETWMM